MRYSTCFFTTCFALLLTPAARAADVLSTLRPGHPRVLVTPGDWERIKAGIDKDPELQAWHKTLLAEGEKTLAQKPVEHVLIGPRLLDKSRTALRRISLLAALYRLDGDKRFADRAIVEMLDVAAFADWNPKHFLDVAEMTNAASLGYDWLYDVLTPEQRATVRQAIVDKGLKEGLKIYQKQTWWTVAHHNWNQVCNGGMTIGALAIADEEPELARQIVDFGRKSIPLALHTYGPDGGWPEGPGYWNYATSYTVFYLAAVETALNTDFGFKETPGFSQTGIFEIDAVGPIGQTFNYADAHPGAGTAPALFWMARTFHQPAYAAAERRLVELSGTGSVQNGSATPRKGGKPSIFDIIWAVSAAPADNAADAQRDKGIAQLAQYKLPTNAAFRGVDVAFFRSSWDDPKAFYIGFKGGDNKANHSHLDLGTFVLDAFGERWAADLGSDEYNLPNYFGKDRFTYYRLRTEGHNTLSFGTENQVTNAKAPLIAYHSGADVSYAVADLTAGYAPKARRVQRGIALIEGKRVLLHDEVDAAPGQKLVWNFHTGAKVEIAADGASAVLSHGTTKLKATILQPAGAKFESISANPPPPQGQQPDVTNLTIPLTTTDAPLGIAVLFSAPNDGAAPKLDTLASWIAAGKLDRKD